MSSRVAPRDDERDAAARAAGLARRWVRGYTAWVGAEAAERRRAEIACDVWEQRAYARERGTAPATVALSIAGRVIAGIPADLTWVHTQRLAMRGLPADRKARTMNTLGRIIFRWWWVIGAAALAMLGIIALFSADRDLQRTQVTIIVAALIAGIGLRQFLPRTAATLVVIGAAVPALLIWAPWIMVIGIATVVGAAIEVVRLTPGATARILAVLGLVALIGAWFWVGAAGLSAPEGLGVLVPLLLAAGGVALLIATGVKRRPAAVV